MAVFLFPINGLSIFIIAMALIFLVLMFMIVHAKQIDELDDLEENSDVQDKGGE